METYWLHTITAAGGGRTRPKEIIPSTEYRKKVLFLLREKPHTPREIANYLDIHLSHTSQILKQLSSKKLIECLNPNVTKGRLYGLTNFGMDIAEKLESFK